MQNSHRRWGKSPERALGLGGNLPTRVDQDDSKKQSRRHHLYKKYGIGGCLIILICFFLAHNFGFSGTTSANVHTASTTSLSKEEVLAQPFYNESMVQFMTQEGSFVIQLYTAEAPLTTANFRNLIEEKFYDQKQVGFYRLEPGSILQGGGYVAGLKSPFENVPVEYSIPSLERMVVLARSSKDPASGNSEFAVMLQDNSEENAPKEGSPGYTTFGRVVQGWNTIQKISKRMKAGFAEQEAGKNILPFTKASFVSRLTHASPEIRLVLEQITDLLDADHAAVIFTDKKGQEEELVPYFSDLQAKAKLVNLETMQQKDIYKRVLKVSTGLSSFPLIVLGSRAYSATDIHRLAREGALRELVERTGALADAYVQEIIQKYPLVVFSKTYCPFCRRTKGLLAELGAIPHVIELDIREDGPALQQALARLTGRRTVPNVFLAGVSIGGGDETLKLHQADELAPKLKQAGAL